MKLVINKCYGGFGLSSDAILKLINFDCRSIKIQTESSYTSENLIDKKNHEEIGSGFTKGRFENVLYKDGLVYRYNDESRADPILIQVVEIMGKEANGSNAKLSIVEIPDDIEYTIEEYDGIEWVAEAHKTWG